MLAILFCLLILVPSAADKPGGNVEPQTSASDSDDSTIYATTIVELFRREPRRADRIVLPPETESYHSPTIEFLDTKGDRGFRKSRNSTLEAFVKADQSALSLDRSAIASKLRALLSDPNLELINPDHMTPNRLTLSAIGFNRERSKAFVTAIYVCGPLCGLGADFFFERKGGKWKSVSPKGASWSQISF
jgi:hypothetical protein